MFLIPHLSSKRMLNSIYHSLMSCSVSRKRVSTCPGHDIIIGVFVDGVHLFRAGQFVGATIRLTAVNQNVLHLADNALGVVPGGIHPLPGHIRHKAAFVKNTVAQQLQARLFQVGEVGQQIPLVLVLGRGGDVGANGGNLGKQAVPLLFGEVGTPLCGSFSFRALLQFVRKISHGGLPSVC